MRSACPDELPVLSAGGHADPREGACVMEYVAVLAGEPFGDHPNCVHPALAVLSRWVNEGAPSGGGRRSRPTLA